MKLLLSLILLIVITISQTNSIRIGGRGRIDHSKIKNRDNHLKAQQCFTNPSSYPDGYTAGFEQISFNGNFPSNDGVQQLSYYEDGYIDADFVNQQIYVAYEFDDGSENGLSAGKLFGFASNNTQYIIVSENGKQYCIPQPLKFPVPNPSDFKYIGDYPLGTIDCELFSVSKAIITGNFTDKIALVNKQDCSITSSNSRNINSPTGYQLMNFYDYTPKSNPSLFELPSFCFTTPTLKEKQTLKRLEKSIKLPKIIENYPL